jgi:hypothetical protein
MGVGEPQVVPNDAVPGAHLVCATRMQPTALRGVDIVDEAVHHGQQDENEE